MSGGTDLVTLRERRDTVLTLLSDRFADDTLDVDELDTRLARAHAASSIAELDALVADLAPSALAVASPSTPARLDDPDRPADRRRTTLIGGYEQKGRWLVPRRLRLRCGIGGAALDLREANLAPGVTEIHVVCGIGGLEVLVPPGVAVECDLTTVIGGVDEDLLDAGDGPVRARVRITGVILIGGVEVATRLPGESGRDARRRRKAKKRGALPAADVPQLPPGREPPRSVD